MYILMALLHLQFLATKILYAIHFGLLQPIYSL